MEVNSKIAICLNEKDIPQFAMQFPGLGMDQDLWARASLSGHLSRFAFSRSCPVAVTGKGSNFRKLPNLLHHFSLPAPTHSSGLFTAAQHILPHLFPATTFSNKSGIHSALNAKSSHWLLVSLNKIFYLKLLVFRKKPTKLPL